MSEQSKTPRLCQHHFGMHDLKCTRGCGEICVSAEPEKVNAHVVRLQSDLADARAALREHLEAHEAHFPPFDMGQRAQDEWSQRRADADERARAILAKSQP